ncbi:MAG: phosphodiester glycosidase family protein [Pseudomonadota bacterium]
MWTHIRAVAGLSLALIVPAGVGAVSCAQGVFEELPFTACLVDPGSEALRLWHAGPDGQIFGTFDRLEAELAETGQKLGFAMNGGMYHDDRSPVGLYVEDGAEKARLVTQAGPGNFGLLPNGVFCLADDGTARVIETLAFAAEASSCAFASQSGPMLVIEGALHPKFLQNGTSLNIRNGVGVTREGDVVFAISDAPVNFHQFARLFRDALDAPNALYIDGKVSRLYAPDLGRHDRGFPLGPIVGTVVPAD